MYEFWESYSQKLHDLSDTTHITSLSHIIIIVILLMHVMPHYVHVIPHYAHAVPDYYPHISAPLLAQKLHMSDTTAYNQLVSYNIVILDFLFDIISFQHVLHFDVGRSEIEWNMNLIIEILVLT